MVNLRKSIDKCRINMGNDEKIYRQIMNKSYDEENLVKCASSYNFKNNFIN